MGGINDRTHPVNLRPQDRNPREHGLGVQIALHALVILPLTAITVGARGLVQNSKPGFHGIPRYFMSTPLCSPTSVLASRVWETTLGGLQVNRW